VERGRGVRNKTEIVDHSWCGGEIMTNPSKNARKILYIENGMKSHE
jgi:hypothetical protein